MSIGSTNVSHSLSIIIVTGCISVLKLRLNLPSMLSRLTALAPETVIDGIITVFPFTGLYFSLFGPAHNSGKYDK